MSSRAKTAGNPDAGDAEAGTYESGRRTRLKILDQAEQLIADNGLEGTSVRSIALAAGVPVALVNYHFGGKDGLYRAIFERHAPRIIDQREAGLDLAATEPDPERRLELIVKTIIVPMFRLRGEEKNSCFGRIMAREVIDPKCWERGIVAQFMDPIARKVIDALTECLPDRSRAEIHWSYHAILGAMVFIMSDTGRIKMLSEGACDPDDFEQSTAHIVSLMTAALKHSRNP